MNISLLNFYIKAIGIHVCVCLCMCFYISQVNGQILDYNTCQEISHKAVSGFHSREIYKGLSI